jgi:hypothetical protein
VSTIHAALDRNGLVKRRKRRRYKASGTPLAAAHAPNGLWCADYKGEFLLGNRQYCYPLTITDDCSRYLLACEGLESTKSKFAFSIFERTIRVTRCGRICLGNRKINLSTALAQQLVGIREVDDQVWQVSFMHYDLGFFDNESCRVEAAENPFGVRVLPMPPE